MEALVQVLEGKRVVHHHTHRYDDILTVLRLREEFGFRVVLQHVTEGWRVAREIAAAGVPCSIILIDSPGGKLEAMNLSMDNGRILDSAGALVLETAQERIRAVINEIGHEAQVGFHGHQNLSMGIANSVLAYQAGAKQIDGALCALGAGAGNSPTEVLAATFERMGIRTGVDLGEVLSAAEDVVRPFIPRLPWMDRSSITQGYAGVYSSFLLHAERAAERYGVAAHQILQRVGEAGYVGGQEDMIIDIALQLKQEQELGDLAGMGVR